ncbi:hypothetical protein Tco_0144872 [Tanacetum coccineum]
MSSDEASSGVTYTSISTHAPLSPDYVSGPEYPEYFAPSDEEVSIEDQPYVVADSPIALSPGYIADSDPEDESEDGPTYYPADGGDDDDDDSSRDDADDEDEEEASKDDEEEEEEHLAPDNSTAAASPVMDPVPSDKETEPFETDESVATPPPPPAYRTITRMYIRAQIPIPFFPPSDAKVLTTSVIPTPPHLPHTSLSFTLPRITLHPISFTITTTTPTVTLRHVHLRLQGSRDPVEDCITTIITFILTTTITTTYHTSTHQSIYGSDESYCCIHLNPSISIRDTTIRDTTIRDTTIRDTTTFTYTITYIITTFASALY